MRFPLVMDGETHTYTVHLADNPRWRNLISTLRFAPCSTKDAQVVIDILNLVK